MRFPSAPTPTFAAETGAGAATVSGPGAQSPAAGAAAPAGAALPAGAAAPAGAALPAGAAAPPAGDAAWRATLPEDIRADPGLAKYSSVEALARGYVGAQKLIGQRLGVPAPDAPAADWEKFHAQVRPAAPSAYELKVEAPAGVPVDRGLLEAAKGWFHEAGLSQRQAQAVVSKFMAANAAEYTRLVEADQAARAEAEGTLKREWGQAYPEKIERALRAATTVGGEDFSKFLSTTALGNAPEMLRFLAAVGERIAEDGGAMGSGRGGTALTPAAAEAELKALAMDAEHQKALNNPDHPGHKEAVAKRLALFEARYARVA